MLFYSAGSDELKECVFNHGFAAFHSGMMQSRFQILGAAKCHLRTSCDLALPSQGNMREQARPS